MALVRYPFETALSGSGMILGNSEQHVPPLVFANGSRWSLCALYPGDAPQWRIGVSATWQ
jgi:hypothetical protein